MQLSDDSRARLIRYHTRTTMREQRDILRPFARSADVPVAVPVSDSSETSRAFERTARTRWWLTRHQCSGPLAVSLCLVLLVVLLAGRDLQLPGLYGDEIIQITPLLPFIGHYLPVLFNGVPETQVTLAGRPFPLMTMHYIGSLKTMLYAPVGIAFGISTSSIRLFTIAVAALVVVLTYAFTRRVFSQPAAVLTGLLLALDASFIFRTKVDWGPNALALACKMTALLALVAWWKSRRNSLLAVGGFVAGLGLYNKSDFSWVLASLSLAAIMVYHRELREVANVRRIAILAGSFLAGASIFIWYNLRYPLIAFGDANPQHVSVWHPDVLWGNFQDRLTLLSQLLNGTSMNAELGFGPKDTGPFTFGTPMTFVFVASLLMALLVVAVGRRQHRELTRAITWLVLGIALFLLFATLTPAAFGHHHILNIYPFPQMLVAVILTEGVGCLVRFVQPLAARIARLGAIAVMLVLVGSDLVVQRNSARAMEASGGSGRWSDSIYRLAADLRSRPPGEQVHLMDWGLMGRVAVLLDGRIQGIDEPWTALIDRATSPLEERQLLQERRSEFVVDAPGTVAFPAAWELFQTYALHHGRQERLLKVYRQRDGTPTTLVYRFDSFGGKTAIQQVNQLSVRVKLLRRNADLSIQTEPGVSTTNDTIITWKTDDSGPGQVYVSTDGGADVLFSSGASGSEAVSWVFPGRRYVFRLYRGNDRSSLLAIARVTVR